MSNASQDRLKALHELQSFIEHTFSNDEALEKNSLFYKDHLLNHAIAKKLYFKFIDQPREIRSHSARSQTDLKSKVLNRLRNMVAPLRSLKPIVLSQALTVGFVSNEKHHRFLLELLPGLQIISLDAVQDNTKQATVQWREVDLELETNHPEIILLIEGIELLLDRIQPKQIIMAEGNSVYDHVISLVARQNGIKTICLQYGWAFIPHIGFQHMGHSEFWSWGPAFSDVLQPYNPTTIFRNIGHQTVPLNPPHVEEHQVIGVFFQAPVRWMGEDTFKRFNQTCLRLAKLGYKLKLRAHPSWPLDQSVIEQFDRFDNVEWVKHDELSLTAQLLECGIALTVFSSVGFEAIAAKRIPIFFQPELNVTMLPSLDRIPFQCVFQEEEDLLIRLSALMSREFYENQVEQLGSVNNESFFSERIPACEILKHEY